MNLLSNSKAIGLFFLIFIAFTGLFAANQVVVHSQASEAFMTQRALDDKKEFYTYHFYKGRFHGGNRADPSMNRMSFNDIVVDMANHLQKQNFYPVQENEKSDLLIVVHYGVTSIQQSTDKMLGYTSLEDKLGAAASSAQSTGGGEITGASINAASDLAFVGNADIAANEANELSARYQAQLVGMEKAYSESIGPREEFEYKFLLKDERYFVILMAYDFQKMQRGEAELLWSTRYSIRSVGQSFERAIKDMNLVAGNYFGKHLDDIVKKRVTDKSRVKLGKIELVDTEPEGEVK